MTIAQLELALGDGEIAEWIAFDELEADSRRSRAQQAHEASQGLHRR